MVSRPPVGVIGLGLLGEALARRLLAASFAVAGFDLDPANIAKLAALGGTPMGSIAELARAASIVVLAVFDTDQVEQVVERDLLAALGEGSGTIVLCTSTCDPDRIAALAERVKDRGVRFVETPVVGSSAQVAAGEGVALIGGDAGLVSELESTAESVIATLFPVRFHIGGVGDGGRAKLAVNLILGLNRLALAEGLVFAERIGLDPERFLAVARRSAAYSQAMDTKGLKMVRGDFSPQARARQHLKDIDLMLAKAEQAGQPLPALHVHAEILAACVDHGMGDLDNSVIIAELRRRAAAPARAPRPSTGEGPT
jgi:3-hydroxyisobutyrate dehydrogenase-like beta-hydroxyacid dehydrogenase